MLDPNNTYQMTALRDIMKTAKQTGYINGRASRLPFLAALLAIRDMPISEQDMRKVAADAIAADAT